MVSIKDCLFPIFCLECGAEGEWVCSACWRMIATTGMYCCPVCRESSAGGMCCARCREDSTLRAVVAMTPYHEDWLMGRLIRTYKYQYAKDIERVWPRLITQFFAGPKIDFCSDIIVPVPLHPRRYAERGFNQSAVIAELLAAHLELPVRNILRRERYTKPQARLTRQARQVNIRGVFSLCDSGSITGARILLVDDIYTTGSTMAECARVLLAAGARSVSGFTLARG